jgi:mitochondrial fission protein ELM1
MSEPRPHIWLLLGSRRGDNNQVLALGEALGLPFETRTLSYRPMWGVLLKLFPRGLSHLRSASRRWLKPPWPDLVIGIGRRSVPVARWIRDRSGGRTKLVRLGHPRAPNALFDLVITTRQYPVSADDNVLVLPLALNRFRKPPKPTAEEQAYLDSRPRPHLLLSLGGTAPMWRLDIGALREAAASLAERAAAAGGTLVVIGSPRTPGEAWQAVLEATQANDNVAIVTSEVRYPVLLGDADEQFVTADSVSMISEAVLTGKPVGLIPVEPDSRGRRQFEGRDPATTDVRDPRRFWADVEARALAGTVEDPKRGEVEDPVETSVAAVKRRLGGLFE